MKSRKNDYYLNLFLSNNLFDAMPSKRTPAEFDKTTKPSHKVNSRISP